MDNRIIAALAIAAGLATVAHQQTDGRRSLFSSLHNEAIALSQGVDIAADNAKKRAAMLAQITAGGCASTDIAITELTIFATSQPGDCIRKGDTVAMIGLDRTPEIIINHTETNDTNETGNDSERGAGRRPGS